MSSYTKPAFVVNGGWGPETRKHSAFRFLEALALWFDKADHSDVADYYHTDVSVKTPHAELLDDGHDSVTQTVERFYDEEWKHFPNRLIAIESDEGYDTYIEAEMFANVGGSPSASEERVKDPEGKEWDVKYPVFYHHQLVKEKGAPHEGLRARHVVMIRDTGIVIDMLDKRGVKRG